MRQEISGALRTARLDAGLSVRGLARAAGVGASTIAALERGRHDPSTEVLARLGATLGMELSVKLYPGTGPIVRDHLQAAMIEASLAILHPRWRPTPDVAVDRPVRGVIDLVLEAPIPLLVAMEAQSRLRRLEQQIRWSRAKADALSATRATPVSCLLLLRSTRQNRAVVSEYAATMEAAYPAQSKDIYAALVGESIWPGDGILWAEVGSDGARILDTPPRNVRVGR